MGLEAREHESATAIAAAAGVQARQGDSCREALRRAEEHIAFARASHSMRLCGPGADDDIVDPIAVDVARSAHGIARDVGLPDAGEHEAAAAVAAAIRVQAREWQHWREGPRRAEDDVAL